MPQARRSAVNRWRWLRRCAKLRHGSSNCRWRPIRRWLTCISSTRSTAAQSSVSSARIRQPKSASRGWSRWHSTDARWSGNPRLGARASRPHRWVRGRPWVRGRRWVRGRPARTAFGRRSPGEQLIWETSCHPSQHRVSYR